MSRRVRVARGALIALLALLLCFIWGNSLQSREDSSHLSQGVTEMLRPVLEVFVGQGNVSDHLVRKLAHFTEFFALGGALAALARVSGRRGAKAFLLCLLAGLLAGAMDETIQLFSARGAQVQDVALDFAGAAAGVSALWLLARVKGRGRRKNGA